MEKYCYLNGKILETKKANVNITDIGILRGFGIFDFLRTYDGAPFLFDEHLERLEKSAKLVNLRLPFSKDKIKKIIFELIEKNKAKNVGIRIVLTGGPTEDGLSWDENKSTFFILMQKSKKDMTLYDKGIKLITVNHQREIPKAKTNNYITRLKFDLARTKAGAVEILYEHNGKILECSTSNIFMIKNNKIITPKDNILYGTCRHSVINIAKGIYEMEEREIGYDEIINADEVFISATNKDVLPVVKIDDKKIGNGKVGENTKKLMVLYSEFVEKNK